MEIDMLEVLAVLKIDTFSEQIWFASTAKNAIGTGGRIN